MDDRKNLRMIRGRLALYYALLALSAIFMAVALVVIILNDDPGLRYGLAVAEGGVFFFVGGLVAMMVRGLVKSRRLTARLTWIADLFGPDAEGVSDRDTFALEAGKLSYSPHAEKRRNEEGVAPFVLAFSFTEVRGTGATVSSIRQESNRVLLDMFAAHYDKPENVKGVTEKGEFLVLGYAKLGDEELLFSDATAFAHQIQEYFDTRNHLPSLSIMIGSAQVKPDEGIFIAINHALHAMNSNLADRLSCDLAIYSETLVKAEQERRNLDDEISRALLNHEFVIYYQGKFDLKTRRFYGAEALIRWRHPKRGLVPPSSFIPYCEHSGKILEIDRYVFEQVARDLSDWNNRGLRRLTVSVNLSRRSVYDPSLLGNMEETLKRYGVSHNQLDMELTESLASENIVFIPAIIRRIKAMGMITSMDDFGVGYSSLSSLKSIPFNVLKIDKSFIDDIEVSEKGRAMVRSIIELVHAMDMRTIAEGVETETQVRILASLGLDAVQGFYFARPMEKSKFEAMLRDNPFEKGGR